MKHLYALKISFLTILSAACINAAAQTTLAAGDIAFTGYNSSDNTVNGTAINDDFSFVLLRSIDSGTTIYFTDFGWRTDAPAFQTAWPCGAGTGIGTGAVGDGIVQWKATSDMTYGAQVLVRSKFSPTTSAGTATGTQATYNSSTQYVNIAQNESLFAYQGTIGSPMLIAGINTNTSGWATTLTNCEFTSVSSSLPTALSTNNYAFALLPTTPNGRLQPSVSIPANAAAARAAIALPANWEFSGTAQQLPAANVVLPITLISFDGRREGNATLLTWEAGQEEGIAAYTIEHSTDGARFIAVGQVAPFNKYGSRYRFTHKAGAGLSYYRLRISEADGTVGYSKVVSVNNGTTPVSALSIMPNPAGAMVTVRLAEVVHGQRLMLTDLAGRVLVTQEPAETTTIFDLRTVPAGIYLLRYGGEVVRVSKQ